MIGKLIKAFAVIILIISLVATMFYGFQLLDDGDEELLGLVVICAGSIGSIFSFAMLYGYGHLIDTNNELNKKMSKLIESNNRLLAQLNCAPSYAAPAPATPVQPVVPASQMKTTPIMESEPTITIPPVVSATPAANSFDDTVVLPSDLNTTTSENTGWTCSNCGTQFPTLTAFCKVCGNKRI